MSALLLLGAKPTAASEQPQKQQAVDSIQAGRDARRGAVSRVACAEPGNTVETLVLRGLLLVWALPRRSEWLTDSMHESLLRPPAIALNAWREDVWSNFKTQLVRTTRDDRNKVCFALLFYFCLCLVSRDSRSHIATQVSANKDVELDASRSVASQPDHAEHLQETVLLKRFPAYSVVIPNALLWVRRLLAEYDTLLVLPDRSEMLRLSPPSTWRDTCNADELREFPTLKGLPGKVVYGEASDSGKFVTDFLNKFEPLDLRPLELLLLFDKVAVDCARSAPPTIREQLELAQHYAESLPPNLSLVTLLAAGRVEIKLLRPELLTASHDLTWTKTKRRKFMEQELASKDAELAAKDAELAAKDHLIAHLMEQLRLQQA
jgi:hypothetical protein